jgi:hypothetical protein
MGRLRILQPSFAAKRLMKLESSQLKRFPFDLGSKTALALLRLTRFYGEPDATSPETLWTEFGPRASKAGAAEGTMLRTELVFTIKYGLRRHARARFI